MTTSGVCSGRSGTTEADERALERGPCLPDAGGDLLVEESVVGIELVVHELDRDTGPAHRHDTFFAGLRCWELFDDGERDLAGDRPFGKGGHGSGFGCGLCLEDTSLERLGGAICFEGSPTVITFCDAVVLEVVEERRIVRPVAGSFFALEAQRVGPRLRGELALVGVLRLLGLRFRHEISLRSCEPDLF